MSRFVFTISLIRPGSTTPIDITNRVMTVGSIEEGIGDPSELFAQLVGEMPITADNQDGFFTQEFNPSVVNLRSQSFHIDIFRDELRVFKGRIYGESIEFDRTAETVDFSVLGPLTLPAETDAASPGIKRNFDGMTTIESAPEGSDFIKIDGVYPLKGGDVIRLQDSDQLTFTISGFSDSGTRISLNGAIPEGEEIPAGTPVEVLTPFPRDESIRTVVEQLFTVSGVVDYDVLFSGLISDRPFLSAFNTSGTEYGNPRGLIAGVPNDLRVIFVREFGGNFESRVEGATNFDDGFSPLGVIEPFFAEKSGNWFSPYESGQATPVLVAFSKVVLGRADSFEWDTVPTGATPPKTQYKMSVSRYTGWKTGGLGDGVMYELYSEQVVDAITLIAGGIPRATLIPDWENGSQDYLVEVRKWDSTDFGANWTRDFTFDGTGSHVLASESGPQSGSIMFLGGADDPDRRYIDPERDWSISGTDQMGAGGVLYTTTQEAPGANPVVRRLPLKAGGGSVDGTLAALLHQNAGSCQLVADAAGVPSFPIFWRNLVDASGNAIASMVRDRETWTGSAFTNVSEAAAGIANLGIQYRTLTWKGDLGADNQIACISRSNTGCSWYVIKSNATELSILSSGLISPDYSPGIDNALEAARYMPFRRPTPQFHVQDFDFLTPWNVTLPQGDVIVWVGVGFGKIFVLGNVFTGFIRYFDFENLSCLEALHECAFLVNASPRVLVADGDPIRGIPTIDGEPFGVFRSRDLLGNLVKPVEDFGGGVPPSPGNPAGDTLLVEVEDRRVWENNFDHLVLTNGESGDDEITVEAGDADRRQDGIEIEARLLENREFAQVVADNLVRNFGSIASTAALPSFAISTAYSGASGASEVRYRVVAYNGGGQPIAASNIEPQSLISDPPTFGSPINISWSPVAGATSYRLYRVASNVTATAFQWNQIGFLSVSSSTSRNDNGPIIDNSLPVTTTSTSVSTLRQAATIRVLDDGTIYKPGDEVIFPDLYNSIQPATPTTPVGGPLHWIIEQVEMEVEEVTIGLEVFQKDLTS